MPSDLGPVNAASRSFRYPHSSKDRSLSSNLLGGGAQLALADKISAPQRSNDQNDHGKVNVGPCLCEHATMPGKQTRSTICIVATYAVKDDCRTCGFTDISDDEKRKDHYICQSLVRMHDVRQGQLVREIAVNRRLSVQLSCSSGLLLMRAYARKCGARQSIV
ncbi:hypothetical protein PHSY_004150 [Pseudozyma hubeiensis SY62]|uniref:Uncharacterized protein n=1 Tax=Pseudozyma hubeiensis (strain SY62) TaxID=1305764 RepID=R9P5G8_PSEHS|nr:hypothetical protein PHSY_004150 [Pseudozyma hubeiensis SY62]GAC96569.1 hypothetical protein PHSY_004150 [Pseudozyma hubeiensis SY62]